MHKIGVVILRAVMRSIGRRSSPALRRFIVVMSLFHLWVYRRTCGLLGRRLGLRHGRILLLTTTGRRTGQPRTVPLLTVEDGDDLVVVASHGGLDEPPAWWLNLAAHPDAVVETAGRRFTVLAETVDDDRYAELWQRLVRAFPGYQDYRRRTDREMPIAVLHLTS